LHLGGRKPQRLGAVELREVALGVDLAHEGALALVRGEEGERGRDRALADAALARDEEQLAIEQVRRGQTENPMLRLSLPLPISTNEMRLPGTPTSRPRLSVSHSVRSSSASTASTSVLRASGDTSS